jgi:hypothetical protein
MPNGAKAAISHAMTNGVMLRVSCFLLWKREE